MAETVEEERNAKNNADNVTIDTFCRSTVTINTQRKSANFANVWQISLEILAETIKGYKRLTIKSTINNSAYYHSEEYFSKRNPKSDLLIDSHTSDEKERKNT